MFVKKLLSLAVDRSVHSQNIGVKAVCFEMLVLWLLGLVLLRVAESLHPKVFAIEQVCVDLVAKFTRELAEFIVSISSSSDV